ncbi:MAG: hypothetical protein LUG98_07205 [Tannerellaceae bacterium]|nr:hypothetical protein [Tannerellaceae bacterium]
MKRLMSVGLMACLLLSGCEFTKKRIQETEDDKEQLEREENYQDEVITSPTVTALEDVPVDPKIVRPDIIDNKASIDIYKNENQFIEVQFISMGNKRISARLTSHDTQANIRFCQIIMPDGTADGPFGRDLEYTLSQDGDYKLEICPDMMAGEPWSGTFTVDFELFEE